jgi:hypothetical protein
MPVHCALPSGAHTHATALPFIVTNVQQVGRGFVQVSPKPSPGTHEHTSLTCRQLHGPLGTSGGLPLPLMAAGVALPAGGGLSAGLEGAPASPLMAAGSRPQCHRLLCRTTPAHSLRRVSFRCSLALSMHSSPLQRRFLRRRFQRGSSARSRTRRFCRARSCRPDTTRALRSHRRRMRRRAHRRAPCPRPAAHSRKGGRFVTKHSRSGDRRREVSCRYGPSKRAPQRCNAGAT